LFLTPFSQQGSVVFNRVVRIYYVEGPLLLYNLQDSTRYP